MIEEKWLNIVGYEERYQVSDCGGIKRFNRDKRSLPFTILKPTIGTHGYFTLTLSKNKNKKRYFVHRLVLEAFVGLCPKGMECRHLNGIKTDNRLCNLKWGTRKQNAQDTINHGHHYQPNNDGIRNGLSKLNNNKVKEIRKLHSEGVSQKELSIRFGVGTTTICSIVNNKIWKHVL